ncbi:MAG: hypothetical protein K0S80_4910 [Neobacillus sp.]|jgi:hypothetical protein|nr:hypothetical protein [Neobacillus sp.]
MREKKIQTKLGFNSRVVYELLGSEIIESDSIVIAEQIKNAEDAGAKNVTIDFSKFDEGEIIISDDGNGMSYEDIKNYWLMIGTPNKMDSNALTGGKGVGRLSLFRLADEINVETINSGNKYSFLITKKQLQENDDALSNDFTINISPSKENSRTSITLRSVNNNINFAEIECDLENLVIPTNKKIYSVKYPEYFSKTKFYNPEDMIQFAPFHVNASFKGINLPIYHFKCTFNGTIIYENKILSDRIFNQTREIVSNLDLGKIDVEIHNFFFDKKFKKALPLDEDDIKRSFLSAYQGISVYRNKYKIYGHGSTDWLKLAELRLKRSGDNIDNKQSFGFINLDNENSKTLKEKTSREGFIKSPELIYFKEMTLAIVKQFGLDRKKAKKALLKHISESIDTHSKSENNELTVDENIFTSRVSTNETTTELEITNIPPILSITSNSELQTDDEKNREGENETPNTSCEDGSIKHIPQGKIIDSSFSYYQDTPLKIKEIIEELKKVGKNYVYSQALLLRCLIDISTTYFQEKHNIQHASENLLGNIKSSLNNMTMNNLIDRTHSSRISATLKKDKTVAFFNGVAHDYSFRPNHTDLKEIWNVFEIFIKTCIKTL